MFFLENFLWEFYKLLKLKELLDAVSYSLADLNMNIY